MNNDSPKDVIMKDFTQKDYSQFQYQSHNHDQSTHNSKSNNAHHSNSNNAHHSNSNNTHQSYPSLNPSLYPSLNPTSLTRNPTLYPSLNPTLHPSTNPTMNPSLNFPLPPNQSLNIPNNNSHSSYSESKTNSNTDFCGSYTRQSLSLKVKYDMPAEVTPADFDILSSTLGARRIAMYEDGIHSVGQCFFCCETVNRGVFIIESLLFTPKKTAFPFLRRFYADLPRIACYECSNHNARRNNQIITAKPAKSVPISVVWASYLSLHNNSDNNQKQQSQTTKAKTNPIPNPTNNTVIENTMFSNNSDINQKQQSQTTKAKTNPIPNPNTNNTVIENTMLSTSPLITMIRVSDIPSLEGPSPPQKVKSKVKPNEQSILNTIGANKTVKNGANKTVKNGANKTVKNGANKTVKNGANKTVKNGANKTVKNVKNGANKTVKKENFWGNLNAGNYIDCT